MSRFLDASNKFFASSHWENIDKKLQEFISKDDVPDYILRTHRVVSVLRDDMMRLDADLFPLKNWTILLQNLTNVAQMLQSMPNYKSINQNNLNTLNTSVDNLVAHVYPYLPNKLEASLEKKMSYVLDAVKSIEIKRENANKSLSEIVDYKAKAESHLASLHKLKDELDFLRDEILGNEEQQGLSEIAKNNIAEIKEVFDSAERFKMELFEGIDDDQALRKKIILAKKEIEDDRDEIKETLLSVEDKVLMLQDFYKKVYGDVDSEIIGLKEEVDKRIDSIDKFSASQKVRYDTLNNQIDSLLPGATSAGLATAYHSLRMSFVKPIKHATWLFYFAIALLFALALFTFNSFPSQADLTIDSVVNSFVYRLPLYVPLFWFAFYVSKRRSEYSRLQQEYAHKEALAKSYQSLMKQIAELEESDNVMLKMLMTRASDAIAFNASDTMDGKHGDKHPEDDAVEGIISKVTSRDKD